MRFTEESGSAAAIASPGCRMGGGAHMCLGLHFAYMQAKCFARHFLQNLEVSLEPGYEPDWQIWPIPKTARRAAGGGEGDLKPVRVGWAKERSDVPTIFLHLVCREMVGSLRFSPPTNLRVHFTSVVSCAPSSATNTAINSAGSVMLALAETRCVAPGGSKKDCPTLERLDRSAGQLRTNFALGDIRGDRASHAGALGVKPPGP